MRNFTVVGAVIVTLLQFGSSASAATTRFVDDDHKQCPQATFTKIQAAIDASAGHDLVRVCAGRYPEQLTLPASKPALYVDSFPALAATVAPPAGGLTVVPDPDAVDQHLALVTLLGSQQHVVGFNVTGPLLPRLAADVCARPVALDVRGDDSVVDGNTISNLPDSACAEFSLPRSVGVWISALRGVAERSTIRGAAIGIGLQGSVQALAERSTITGRGTASGTYGVFLGDVDNDSYEATDASVRSNDISATGSGIRVVHGSGLVKGNTVHDNGTGIEVDDGAIVDVNANIVRHNAGDGVTSLFFGSMGYGNGGYVRGNDVRSNGHDGIAMYGCSRGCFPSSSDFQISGNYSQGNARFDCFDDMTSYGHVWTSNIGVTDSPATLCSPH
jgi:hypothetical protein